MIRYCPLSIVGHIDLDDLASSDDDIPSRRTAQQYGRHLANRRAVETPRQHARRAVPRPQGIYLYESYA